VAKRKDSIALFEVITKRRSDANLSVPPWMGVKGTAGAEEPAAAPPAQAAAQPAAPGAASRAWSSLASGAGGQLTLKLSYTHLLLAAAVLALVVIVSVWAAYRLGLASSPAKPPQANAPLTTKVPLGQYVVGENAGVAKSKSGSPAPAAAAGTPAPMATRVPGKYYLVIQSIPGGGKAQMDEAGQIAAWCTANGEPATAAVYSQPKASKQWSIVWSLRPFGSPLGADAQEYGKKIETLGRTYKAKYKKYDFRQQNGGKFDPWFVKYTSPSGAAKQ
jgi:hypothetical protein